MSILIKGMEMPTDCAMMLKIFPDGRVGVPIHLNWCGTMVVNDAEAIAVPPHGRLGDLDALAESVATPGIFPPVVSSEVFEFLRNAPTIIPAEPFNNLSKPCKDDNDIPICTKASPASLGIYKKAEEGET